MLKKLGIYICLFVIIFFLVLAGCPAPGGSVDNGDNSGNGEKIYNGGETPPTLWVTNGLIRCMVKDGDILYIGGDFTYVGPLTDRGCSIDGTSGAITSGYNHLDYGVNGDIYACVSDRSGGWYIGGTFSMVGGVTRNNIAHIRADGSPYNWNTNASQAVYALAISGSTVYAGGDFTLIGGQKRYNIVALEASSGNAY